MPLAALFVIASIVVIAGGVSYVLHRVIRRYVPAILATGIVYAAVLLAAGSADIWKSPRRMLVNLTWCGICMGISAYVGWWPEKRRRQVRAEAVQGFTVLPKEENK